MANVWVKAMSGQMLRHDRISELTVENVKGRGWVVLGHPGRGDPVLLASLGRGERARQGAHRLCVEFPQAIEAAKGTPGVTIRYIADGYPKGGGRWSNLVAPGERDWSEDAD